MKNRLSEFGWFLFLLAKHAENFDLHTITLCDVNREGIHVTFDVSIFALVFSGIFRSLFLVQREPENLLNCSNSWLLNVWMARAKLEELK